MSYTINISLPKELAEAVKDHVKRGHFTSVSEVVRASLRSFLQPEVPTFKMSKKAELRAEQAYKEYKEGKTKVIHSVDELDDI